MTTLMFVILVLAGVAGGLVLVVYLFGPRR